jgi:hypothetical protein
LRVALLWLLEAESANPRPGPKWPTDSAHRWIKPALGSLSVMSYASPNPDTVIVCANDKKTKRQRIGL